MKNTTLPSKRALAVLDEPPLTDGTAQAKRVFEKGHRPRSTKWCLVNAGRSPTPPNR
jgi:hypothetical protein